MVSPAKPAPELPKTPSELLRQLPSVDALMNRPSLLALVPSAGRELVLEKTRFVLADWRDRLVSAPNSHAEIGEIEAQIVAQVEAGLQPSLRRVINATGVILHTNLGRAPITKSATDSLVEAATSYSNLEFDLATGQRGKRDVHTEKLLTELTGAESAIVVNNNAAAVFLVLNTVAKGAEVIVSRGELIEIGDGFRIPDIMSESGAELREVGTTNRTRIEDYERAVTDRTKLLLRVHPSNFRIVGFTDRPALEELTSLGRRSGIPVFEDLGSGCLVDLSGSGVHEPVAQASLAAGVNVVTFSGDKMLGGPQAGIIAGDKELVQRIRRNPLYRALRVDKLVIAALQATLLAYRRQAIDEVPTLRMIRITPEEVQQRATEFIRKCAPAARGKASIELRSGHSVIGGGSTPDQQLSTYLISVQSPKLTANELERRLRLPAGGTPVLARIEEDRLVFDLRTVFPEDEEKLASALVAVLQ